MFRYKYKSFISASPAVAPNLDMSNGRHFFTLNLVSILY